MENLRTMKDVLIKIKHIIIGNIYNLLGKNSRLYKKRIQICSKCDKKIILGWTYVCGECGCILSAKTRIPSEKCLLNKW